MHSQTYRYFIDIATIGKPPKMTPEVSEADGLLDNELGS